MRSADLDPGRESRVGLPTKLSFGIGASAEASIGIIFSTFNFLFYNRVLGLSGTLCGLAVTIALLFDGISDPLVGSVSDRLRSRLGRRHPFLYASALPLGVCFAAIYAPPEGLGETGLFLWLTTFTVLLRTFLTFYHVPHLALGAELSRDYRERSVIMSYNAIFAVMGGAGASYLAWTYFGTLPEGTLGRGGYGVMGVVIGGFAAGIVLLSAHGTRSVIPRMTRVPADLPPWRPGAFAAELAGCLRNPNYQSLLLGLVFLSALLGTRETLHSYVNLFFWELPEQHIRFFGLASPPGYLLAFLLAARLHTWFDKRETIIAATTLTAVASILPIALRMLGWFPENGAEALFPWLLAAHFAFYAGIALLNISVLSALADVADEHELLTGRRQEGVFYAARTLFGKMTSGVGHLLAGVALDLIILLPERAVPGEVDADVIWRLGLIEGPVAAVPAFVAIAFYGRYRIDRESHRRIGEALRRQAPPVEPSIAASSS